MIAIVDYKMGNLRSVLKAFKRIGVDAEITSDPLRISSAEKIILPGVGRFEQGIHELKESGLAEILVDQICNQRKPVLGICLGMQLLTRHSEEGNVDGLGIINAHTKKFHFQEKVLKVPHIGWNSVNWSSQSKMYSEEASQSKFYFVHSYYVESDDDNLVKQTTDYGHSFISGFELDNIFGVQFHPEKSHSQGLDLLKKFSELNV